MTFEGQYLTYDEYIELGGSTIGKMPFNLLEFEARRQIDIRTFNRLKNLEEQPQEVKLCVYNLIKTISKISDTQEKASGNIASENTDGYSISYITADKISDIINSNKDEINYVIDNYLAMVIVNGEHIIYCGV